MMRKRHRDSALRGEILESRNLLTIVTYPFEGTGTATYAETGAFYADVPIQGEFRYSTDSETGQFTPIDYSVTVGNQGEHWNRGFAEFDGTALDQWFSVSGTTQWSDGYESSGLWFNLFDGQETLLYENGHLPASLEALFGRDADFEVEYWPTTLDQNRPQFEVEGKVRLLTTDLAPHLSWDNLGNIVVTYEVAESNPGVDTDVRLYWGNADGPSGGPILQPIAIPSAAPNAGEPYVAARLSSLELGNPPPGATRLYAVLDETEAVYRETNTANNIASLPLPKLKATSLSWDAEQGGVRLKYRYEAETDPAIAPRFNLYWVNGTTRVSERLLSDGNTMTRSAADVEVEVFVDSLAAPPAGATALLLVVDDFERVPELNEDDNSRVLAYHAAVDSVIAELDGTGPDDELFGRFLSVPGLIAGQRFTINVSEALAALRAKVVVAIGEVEQVVQWSHGTVYVSPDFDPGNWSEDATVSVQPQVVDTPQGAPWTGTLDVEPLPEWYSALNPASVSFDHLYRNYELAGKLVDISHEALLSVPLDKIAKVPFLDNEKLDSKLIASVSVSVVAGLDPTEAPAVSGKANVLATAIGGINLYDKEFLYPSTDPLQFHLTIDPQTLALVGGSISYDPGPIQPPPTALSLLPGHKIKGGLLSATSALTFSPTIAPKLELLFDTSGRLKDGSYAELRLDGQISGNLLDLSFATNTITTRILSQLLRHVNNVSPPGILVTAISQFLPSVFTLQATGTLSIGGRLNLGPGGISVRPLPGSANLVVSGAVFGIEELMLPSITDLFTTSAEW